MLILADNKRDRQTMLDEINDWCTEWNMSVNIPKTKVNNFVKQTWIKRITNLHCVDMQ